MDIKVKEAIDKLNELAESDDIENAHSQADYIICQFVPEEMREAWRKVPKWYS